MKSIAQSTFRRLAATLAVAGLLSLTPAMATAAVTLPEETFASPKQLQAVLLDVQQRNYDPAVDRIQSLLDKHGAELSKNDNDGLTAVDQFFTTMPAADRVAIAVPYEARFGAAANDLLNRIRAKPDYRPQDLYAVTKRYPFTTVAGTALTLAAERAAEQGDLSSCLVFHSTALLHGWHGEVPPATRDALQAVSSGPTTDGAFGTDGPLPFDAPWYNLSTGFEQPKIFPVGSADLAFVEAEHSVIAFKPDGLVAWRWHDTPSPQPAQPRFQPGTTGRGRLAVPAILADTTGRAAVVVFTQPANNNAGGCINALRASDGRLLWSTDSDALLRSTVLLSPPAVEGRYVIAVGLETTASDATTATLELVAIDITSGHPLWRTPLAGINTNSAARDLDLYRDQSPPTITGDCVLVTPNVGAVFNIDRFDGELRWMRPYRQAVIGDGAIRKFNDQRHRGRELIAPLAWTDLLRWNCTPQVAGGIVVTAPQDTVAVMGLDIVTGQLLWESGNLPQATPVGIAGGNLILSGASLTAIDPKTGQKAWTFTPVAGVRLTGPAVVRGEILVQSTAGLLAVSPADGSAKPSTSTIDFHPIASSEAGKAALAGHGIIGAFDSK